MDSIKEDVAWLGADWEDRLFLASNYFPQMYEAAVKLIKKGKSICLRSDCGRDQRIPRNADKARKKQSVQRKKRRGESETVPGDERRKISGR